DHEHARGGGGLAQGVDPRQRAGFGEDVGDHAEREGGERGRVVRADQDLGEHRGEEVDLVADQRLPPEGEERLVPAHAAARSARQDAARRRDHRRPWYHLRVILGLLLALVQSAADADAAPVLERLNAHRKAAGLDPVSADPSLTKGCAAHAAYLVRNVDDPSTQGLGLHTEKPALPGYTK